MRYSRLLAKTLREVPADIRAPSFRLLLRGGFIRSLSQGLISFLPLGRRVLNRLEGIVREEMEALGGQEVLVPVVNPRSLWKRTGRDVLVGNDLAGFADRSGKSFVLGPSHEEAMVELVRASLHSYRDFPALLFQFQTKFRDEARPKCGLIRSKEFLMKDAYSFHRSFTDLNNFFPRMFAAYQRIFSRLDLRVNALEAGVGYMGGSKSFEFVTECPCGDDIMIYCTACGYKANSDVAVGARDIPMTPPHEMERVHTPGCRTMGALAECLDRPRRELAKPVMYRTASALVMAVVRGDQEVSTEKLARCVEEPILRLASRGELREAGLVPGYLSPIGFTPEPPGAPAREAAGSEAPASGAPPQSAPPSTASLPEAGAGVTIVIDEVVADSPNLVYGANEEDYHYVNVNFGRDYEARPVADIARVKAGDRCVHCGEPLAARRVMELGHVFRLGDFYSRSLDLSFRGERGERIVPHMGSYGIGMGRLMAAVVETHHDEKGIVWPEEVAPFRFYLMSIGRSMSVQKLVQQVYETLGDEVLFDDRHESISTKFKDADLLGIPYRIVVSQESVREGDVELVERATGNVTRLPLQRVPELIRTGKDQEDFVAHV